MGNPSVWAGREHGEVDYYLTQFLTGHGCFTSYLYRMGKVGDLSCVFGDSDLDDARHTFFLCDRWVPERESLEQEIEKITPENIVEIMLSLRDCWDRVATFAKVILLLEGKAHCYVFPTPGCKRWDTCAPEAVLEAAGGILTDIFGKKYSYSNDTDYLNNDGVLAALDPKIHKRCLDILNLTNKT
uniref:3'(2'),5'-bisphosphate nucleotidase 1 n=1 Tax=Rhodnius prolixus TaxID=13249 RepID=T1HX87_RHOPR